MMHINKHYSKEITSLFFKSGFYINQSVIESFCSSITDFYSKSVDDSEFLLIQKENKFGFNFQIRSNKELIYLKFICNISQLLYSAFENRQSNLKLKDYFRFFYILYDSGGKSVLDTNRVFTINTHGPIRDYSLKNVVDNNKKKLNLSFSSLYSSYTQHIDYNLSHILHFKENLNFLLKKTIFPNLIGFDLNYLNLFY